MIFQFSHHALKGLKRTSRRELNLVNTGLFAINLTQCNSDFIVLTLVICAQQGVTLKKTKTKNVCFCFLF